MDCFGTYFTHAQSCDNVRVPSATEWTASVHTLHMPKAVITFVFQVLLGTCSICAFSRFPVFAFSRFRVWFSRFRVFVFSCLVFAFSRFRVLPPASPGPSHTFRMHSKKGTIKKGNFIFQPPLFRGYSLVFFKEY